MKYMVIYRHKEKYAISEMCRFFHVSRSGYYGYVQRMDIPAKDLPLAKKIRECQEHSHSTYGYRRVQVWLERHGIYHNPKTVLRVMQKYNLLSVVRRKKYHNYGTGLHRYPNLLNRDFHADKPNQKWVTDVSYIKTGTEQNINLALSPFAQPKGKRRSPQSCNSTVTRGFSTPLKRISTFQNHTTLRRSMSRRGNPYDNALAENFFSILKIKYLHRVKLRSYEEARLLIAATFTTMSVFSSKQD